MEQLTNLIRSFQGAPVTATMVLSDGSVKEVNLRQFPNGLCDMLSADRGTISHLVLIVGDCDECYEVVFTCTRDDGRVRVGYTVAYHAVDCEPDAYDGRYNGTVVNKRVRRGVVRYLYAYGKHVVVPVRVIATLLESVL